MKFHVKVLLFAIYFVLFSCENRNEKHYEIQEDSPVVLPISSNDSLNTYEIDGLTFNLPKPFYVTKSTGSDFFVYYLQYPQGSFAGLAFSQYADMNYHMSNLIKPEQIYRGTTIDDIKKDPEFLAPYIQLDTVGYYKETYALREFDLEKDSSFVKGHFIIEGVAVDSFYTWYNYPENEAYSDVDIVLDDNMPRSWFVHLFAQTNRYMTWEKVKQLGNQLSASMLKNIEREKTK